MIKLIVTDLDGTLLRTDKTISAYTEHILRQCRAMGIKVVYATGRGHSADGLTPPELFDGNAINNGAVAMVGNAVVYDRLIACEISRPLLLACDTRGLLVGAQRHRLYYTNFDAAELWGPFYTDFEMVDFVQHDIDAEKIFVENCSPDDAAFIESHLPDELYLTVARDGLAMVMHREATKSNAVAALARHWDIAPAEIVAFGDELNDLDLLKYAGIGVAMSNALDEAKAAADVICRSNDEDGAARWLEANLLAKTDNN